MTKNPPWILVQTSVSGTSQAKKSGAAFLRALCNVEREDKEQNM